MSSSNNPFNDLILDDEERAIEAAIERGEYEEAADLAAATEMLQEAAHNYKQLHTSRPVTLRINQLDLIKIKAKAKQSNIPYQTLLGAVLHDFAEGKRKLSIK
jgi:predicted DNA binding CopG/RHH family protein